MTLKVDVGPTFSKLRERFTIFKEGS